MNHADQYLGICPDKVIVTGDSAGGNFALGVTNRAIERGVRVPDGLILAYPALNLDISKFSPSYFIALDNLIVPHTFLKL